MRLLKCGIAVLVALLGFVAWQQPSAGAGLHVRWTLDYEGLKPSMFTYVDAAGGRENFWYVVYTVTNNGEIDSPLHVDLTVRDEKARYYHAGYFPQVEAQIIAHEEHLTGLAKPIQEERVNAFRGRRRYLSASNQRDVGSLKVGESLQGIAVFAGVDLTVKNLDVLVLGLINPVKYRLRKAATPEEESDRFELESKILKLQYKRTGYSLYTQFDYVEFVRKEWVVKLLGVLSDKETIGTLVAALDNADATIRKCASDLLGNLVGDPSRKGFDPEGTIEANKPAILLWREWWSRNRHKLYFDDNTGTFLMKEPAAAGGSN